MSNEWSLPWKGACRCGGVTLEITKAPLLSVACHCTGCQRMTSSAFSLSLAIPTDGFATSGLETALGGLHGEAKHHHCPRCMSWMFTRMPGLDFFVNVRASMLDDRTWFEPYVEVWTKEKLPWATTGAKHSYETMPPMGTFDELMQAYAREARRP